MATNKVYESARAKRDENGATWLDVKDVATLVRQRLKAEFPGIKFAVRSSRFAGGTSVDVEWTDGPTYREVDAIISPYRFSDFDGMIDMSTSRTNWLLPDGTVQLASTLGTEGSMGSYPAYASDCPVPGAILVKGGAKYVHAHHQLSPEVRLANARRVCERFGVDIPLVVDKYGCVRDERGSDPRIRTSHCSEEYLSTLVHQQAEGVL